LEVMACWKSHKSLECLRRTIVKAAAEIPLGVCSDSRVHRASQGLRRSIGQSFWVILL
jgi:hypothetical protein